MSLTMPRLAPIVLALVALAAPLAPPLASAQETNAGEISESHLAAARDAVGSARTARGFDNVLPLLAQQVQNRLIRVRPDLHREITTVVDETALKLVERRPELDNDVARIWAKTFTEDELKIIATFYKSEAGSKLAEIGPQVVAESMQSVKGWSDRVGEELLERSQAELKARGIEF